MDELQAEAYLDRIGATDEAPSLEALADLMLRHLRSVPFENLSIHLGERIALDEPALLDKIVGRRSGGFCYELNGGFGLLLTTLGYDVTLLAARVHRGPEAPDPWGPLFDHLTLRVDLDDVPWLVDVGFGRFISGPVRLDVPEEQPDPGGSVAISETEQDDWDVAQAGRPVLRVERRARTLTDFAPTCWYQQTSPDSHFTQSLTCSLPTETGRVTLSDRLLITTTDGQRTEETLGDDAEVLAAYRTHFGIELDRLPNAPGLRGPESGGDG